MAGTRAARVACRSVISIASSKRVEHEWPLAHTQWTNFYFDFAGGALTKEPPAQPASCTFDAMGSGITFVTAAAVQPNRNYRSVKSGEKNAQHGKNIRIFSARRQEQLHG